MGECSISFPGPVSKKTMCHLITDYLKYILYYRGQFPLPLDQLTAIKSSSSDLQQNSSEVPSSNGHVIFCDTPDRRPLPSAVSSKSLTEARSRQKFLESISKFDDFFNELNRILETKNVLEVVLNLGPNLMNPKELYHVTMPKVCSKEECTTDYASLQNCKVQFFRNIVTSDIWADLKTDSLLPISVMLLLENSDSLDQYMELKRFYTMPKKCKSRSLHIAECCTHIKSSVELQSAESLSHNGCSLSKNVKSSGIWVKLKPDLKGFKSYNETC